VVVLSTPEIAGLPYVITGLVAAGGLAAALSTADGLLLALANALSHDIYYRMINPNAPTKQRLIISRALLVVVAVAAAATAATRPADILSMVAWAFSLAAGGLFPALVLGIWWKRTTNQGAFWGMLVGFGVTLMYLVVTRYFPGFGVSALGMSSLLNPITGAPVVDLAKAMAAPGAMDSWVLASHPLQSKVGWFNINNISAAAFGLPAGFLTMIVVSLMTPAPAKEMQDFIDACRRPRGKTLMDEKTA
jgi:cation/acetate symporter